MTRETENSLKPINRIEYFLDEIVNGSDNPYSPVFRVETFLAKIAGKSVTIPEPIFRHRKISCQNLRRKRRDTAADLPHRVLARSKVRDGDHDARSGLSHRILARRLGKRRNAVADAHGNGHFTDCAGERHRTQHGVPHAVWQVRPRRHSHAVRSRGHRVQQRCAEVQRKPCGYQSR